MFILKRLAHFWMPVLAVMLGIGLWASAPLSAAPAAPAAPQGLNNAPIARSDPGRLFGISSFQNLLFEIDPVTYAGFTATRPITVAGFTVTGVNGMAIHPTTGDIYVILKLSGVSGRVLGILDPLTASATIIGNLGANFSNLAFTNAGVLYGVTGDGATPPETLFTIDPATAATTLFMALGNGADGEIIAYNPDDGFLYHASGNSTVVFEKIDLQTQTTTNIPPGTSGEIFSLRYIGNDTFLATNISSQLQHVTITGTFTTFGPSLADDFRGIIPAGTTAAYTTTEDITLTVTISQNHVLLNDYDADADPLTAVLDTPPAHAASFTLNPDGSFSYTPMANYCGADSFTYHAHDGFQDSNIAIVPLEVVCEPDVPVAEDDTYMVAQNSQDNPLDVLINDSEGDGDPFSITAVGTPNQGGAVLTSGSIITYTPANGFFGTEVFTYTIDDGVDGTDTAVVTVTVNAPPVADNDTYTVDEDSANNVLDVLTGDTDPNMDPLTVTNLGATNEGGTIATNGTVITYTPTADFFGTEVFTYTIFDGFFGTDTAVVTVTVNNVNDAPTADDDSYTVDEDTTTALAVLVGDTDIEMDPLTIVALGTPDANGTIATNGTVITYTPAADFFGTEVFTYTIADGAMGMDTAVVTVTVDAVNDAPIAFAQVYTVTAGTTLTIAVPGVLDGATDVDGDTLTAVLEADATTGTLLLNSNGSFTYDAPAAAEGGTVIFSYRAHDGQTSSAAVRVTINILPAPITSYTLYLPLITRP